MISEVCQFQYLIDTALHQQKQTMQHWAFVETMHIQLTNNRYRKQFAQRFKEYCMKMHDCAALLVEINKKMPYAMCQELKFVIIW